MSKEAKARIKINKLLEEAGWGFFENNSRARGVDGNPGIAPRTKTNITKLIREGQRLRRDVQ